MNLNKEKVDGTHMTHKQYLVLVVGCQSPQQHAVDRQGRHAQEKQQADVDVEDVDGGEGLMHHPNYITLAVSPIFIR